MGSEEQVLELMMLLDEGLLEATKLEEKLDEYDHKLQVCASKETNQKTQKGVLICIGLTSRWSPMKLYMIPIDRLNDSDFTSSSAWMKRVGNKPHSKIQCKIFALLFHLI